jgi:pimeloyl-ACP methyl ester carboxylesterase
VQRIVAVALALACLALGLSNSVQAKDLKGWGVVLIHGKKGSPASLSGLASALSAAGAITASPHMPWPGGYRTYDAVLNEIGAQVAALRSKGATRIAVAGHSIGANMALGYGAQRGGVEAVIAMGPGHQPDRFIRRTGDSLARAKQAVAAGHGGEVNTYTDVNQGDVFQVRTSAASYVSFFDPNGPAAQMTSNAGRLKRAKLLWVVGTGDPGARAVAHGGKVITVSAGHGNTPSAGGAEIVAWLESL